MQIAHLYNDMLGAIAKQYVPMDGLLIQAVKHTNGVYVHMRH